MSAAAGTRTVYLDLTHLGRHVTGIERITIEQFEKVPFKGARVVPVRSRGVLSMIFAQQILLPLLMLLRPRACFVFPGFPPSPLFVLARNRVILYVHDLFLITRRQDLSLKAKLYMALPFRIAVRGLKYFLANSNRTRSELSAYVAKDAAIALYRPMVANVFDIPRQKSAERDTAAGPLKILALGTVEPRKNYRAAADIVDALAEEGFAGAELHIVGREGWGEDAQALAANPRVHLHGYLPAEDARRLIGSADLYLSTSHDEGLGLPLLEVQFAGLQVVAPDAPVFREVLDRSGLFIDTDRPRDAARRIADFVAAPGWRQRATEAAHANLARWNSLARTDTAKAVRLFERDLDQSVTTAATGAMS